MISYDIPGWGKPTSCLIRSSRSLLSSMLLGSTTHVVSCISSKSAPPSLYLKSERNFDQTRFFGGMAWRNCVHFAPISASDSNQQIAWCKKDIFLLLTFALKSLASPWGICDCEGWRCALLVPPPLPNGSPLAGARFARTRRRRTVMEAAEAEDSPLRKFLPREKSHALLHSLWKRVRS